MPDVLLPRLSDSMEEGTILSWLRRDGETIGVGDELLEIETDKATMTYESPEEGTLQILVEAGTTLPVGAPIARIGAVTESAEPAAPAAEPQPETQPVEAIPSSEPVRGAGKDGAVGDATLATPLARRVARVHGVDLSAVAGTGPRGRVTRADLVAAASLSEPSPVPPAATTPEPRASPPVTSPHGAKGETTVLEPTRLQQVTARRMAEATATMPLFQVTTEAAMNAVIALRAQLKGLGARLPSVNDFVIKAAALSLREHPKVNASYRDGRHELHGRVNVGVAVAADEGLYVPTVNDADTLSLSAIAAEVRALAARVRDGVISPPELAGATFTVSNLGMYGMTEITPLVNPPQAAILGVGAIRPTLALVDGEVTERSLMTLTVSADHRVLNGADAALFLARIRELLEEPLRLAI
jgi:pyruvate dehydrogenase E2 component (dihydrolipoyllysine-residue acetyltransferase)